MNNCVLLSGCSLWDCFGLITRSGCFARGRLIKRRRCRAVGTKFTFARQEI